MLSARHLARLATHIKLEGSTAGKRMVVPSDIANAARRGDSAIVLAWLDADVSEPRDINDVDETGYTLLYSSTGGSKRMHYRHLALVRALIDPRGGHGRPRVDEARR